MNSLIIISNDRVFLNKKIVSSDFNDTINVIEGLSDKFKIKILARPSYKRKSFSCINKKKINFFKKISLKDDTKILMLSITPFNCFNLLKFIFQIKKLKVYTLIRSDGYKEYYHKFGWIGYLVYHLMFLFVKKKSKIISVSKNFTNLVTNKIVEPSELNERWIKRKKLIKYPKSKIFYLGRFKKEKGIYSAINLFNEAKKKYHFTIAGDNLKLKNYNRNIKIIGKINSVKKIIDLYDAHSIFLLPSYTEGSPKVIKESLARLRPVIVFEEIDHVKNGYFGVYICKRNINNLEKKIHFILTNYQDIQKKMKKNYLSTKKNFQKALINAVQ